MATNGKGFKPGNGLGFGRAVGGGHAALQRSGCRAAARLDAHRVYFGATRRREAMASSA